MQQYSEILRSYDINPSYTRLLIYQYLKEVRSHPTAEEIYRAILGTLPTLSKTTVYNTLHLFTEKHLATMIMMDENETRYDLITKPHAHFKCMNCSKIFDVAIEPPAIDAAFLKDYIVEDAQLLYRGFCPECKKTL